ncbi:MAG: hypothetical protein LKF93_04115 [Bifidobacterium tibiigranuli]|jgi:hypothetical protein|nr:hypothetical protein [Bifidobacterium tibiigranuli]
MSTGISAHTAAHEAKMALAEACRTALSGLPVDVNFGFQWPLVHDDWVSATTIDTSVTDVTVGPRRNQEEIITLHLSVGAFRHGQDEQAEITASAAAFDYLQRISDYVTDADPTLGGTVLWIIPSDLHTDGATTQDDAGQGRLIEIDASFKAMHRIRSM